jgi:Protein of unknown function (DUF3710)
MAHRSIEKDEVARNHHRGIVMIFGRSKKRDDEVEPESDELEPVIGRLAEGSRSDAASGEARAAPGTAARSGADTAGAGAIDSDAEEAASPAVAAAEPAEAAGRPGSASVADLDVAALDSMDWRTDGPFDIDEVDLDADTEDDPPRIDLGSMVLTVFPGAELRLQVSEETQQIVSAMLVTSDSALEVGAYAAPRSGGFWSELRDDMIESATDAGGSAALIEGPFGVELRRLLPVSTPDGEQGYQPSRMWVAEGPRWLLRGILYGQAALEDGIESPVAELLTAFRHVVVRRGDEPMAPGDLLPLRMPTGLRPSEPGL